MTHHRCSCPTCRADRIVARVVYILGTSLALGVFLYACNVIGRTV